MSESIPYGKQDISKSDVDAVLEVLRSDWLTQGPVVPAFEKAVAYKCNAQSAVAVNSATSALHIACLALGVGSGDTVWTSPNTFVATANCARYCGATVDFVDIDPDTWCLSIEKLQQKLEEHQASGRSIPKVVIPVHLSGQSCDMQSIYELGKKYGFKIIEDASHAIGGTYQNEPVGSCKYSDITVYSFHPVKIITTGEGGMALTNDLEIYEHMKRLRSHGITSNPKHMTSVSSEPWYYEQIGLGFNYRMTDIHAALGLSQLKRVDNFVEQRNKLAQNYENLLADAPIQRQVVPKDTYSARHLYVIRVPKDKHLSIFEKFRGEEIRVNLHYMPVHLQPYYRKLGFQEGDFPEAEKYRKEAISLPLFFKLTTDKQNQVIAILKKNFECISQLLWIDSAAVFH
jgi:UDP-4-amino-4,6-dideoxy-N-acetyl-beta-L-altrosamine transaminase